MLRKPVCMYACTCVCVRTCVYESSQKQGWAHDQILSLIWRRFTQKSLSLSLSLSFFLRTFHLFLAASNYPRQRPMLPTISPLFRFVPRQLATLMVAGLFSIGETTHVEYRIHKSTETRRLFSFLRSNLNLSPPPPSLPLPLRRPLRFFRFLPPHHHPNTPASCTPFGSRSRVFFPSIVGR